MKQQEKQGLPNAPVNLTSSNVTSTSVDLAWNLVLQADGYNIYQDGAIITSSVTNGYSVTGLTTATTYSYQVSAVGTNGVESALSTALSVTTI